MGNKFIKGGREISVERFKISKQAAEVQLSREEGKHHTPCLPAARGAQKTSHKTPVTNPEMYQKGDTAPQPSWARNSDRLWHISPKSGLFVTLKDIAKQVTQGRLNACRKAAGTSSCCSRVGCMGTLNTTMVGSPKSWLAN